MKAPIWLASEVQRPRPSAGSGLTSLPPLSVYVHFPWCIRKCPYCDFNSHEARGDIPEAAYLDALERDLDQSLPLIWGRQVISVFIGGGTPSLLSASGMDRLLSLLRSRLRLLPNAEITMEANPGAVEAERFQAYAASGINRISLGIQSFDDAKLRALGRIHSADQARHAIDIAQRAVERVNLDLMFALPEQTLAQCQQEVSLALSHGTEHLSLYHLTLEPNTVFAKYPPPVPHEDLAADMQAWIEAALTQAGYEHYEVSAYAKPRGQCRHNLNYWEFGDYLGIGPGAHGKLSFHDRILRQARLKNPRSWMEALQGGMPDAQLTESSEVAAEDLPFEFMLNALRLQGGVPSHRFQDHTGLSLAQIAPALEQAIGQGLLDDDPAVLKATPKGWLYLNDLLTLFLR